MKKILLFVALVFSGTAHAGPMANVEYIHAVIKQQWGIEVPYNPALENPKVAANMKYLLTAVDAANKILNGSAITDYGNGEYATLAAADTIATNEAVDRLIRDEKFYITTTPGTDSFGLEISAAGEFLVNWGDGNIEQITRTDTAAKILYSHTYTKAGMYKIGIDGQATGYNISAYTPAISFNGAQNIAGISGSLGAVFPTIGAGTSGGQQPGFYQTFHGCINMTGTIPENLFAGITGKPIVGMFSGTFAGCSGLTGTIPENLFSGIKGALAGQMFSFTFSDCSGLSGCIPDGLFAGIDATLDKIISSNTPFVGTNINQELCSVSEP